MTSFTGRITHTECTPFSDQRPGTAGLRKKVAVVEQPHYLENFVAATLETADLPAGATLVVGGDGRYGNRRAIRVITAIAAASGVRRIITAKDGLLSTPAASNLIRICAADGGFILTASHNPGGPDGDFGIKYNTATGGQAPESLTEAIYAATQSISGYDLAELPELPLTQVGEHDLNGLTLEVRDPVADYAELMESLFDFDAMAAWIARGNRVVFDGLHGITGPYAKALLGERLGIAAADLLNCTPREDFGGGHPDPNPADAPHLLALAMSDNPPAMIAASDGDGDRNMILGPGLMVSPCDSIAVLLEHAASLPGYSDGIPGVARSMPTSRAVDRVAEAQGIPCFETPTGWRFFCNLLEDGQIGLCGEESFGTGSAHVREKDGLWAVLFWINLLAATDSSVPGLLKRHWQRFGRHYYQRHDYFIANTDAAAALMDALQADPATAAARSGRSAGVEMADAFTYHDPVDGSVSANQGVRLVFSDGARIVFRLSGTGTSGATLRVYLEQLETDPEKQDADVTEYLESLGREAAAAADIENLTGVSEPSYRI